MRKIKEILKLHYERTSNREIARRLGIGAGSVSRYLARAKAANLSWPLADDWTNVSDPGTTAVNSHLRSII